MLDKHVGIVKKLKDELSDDRVEVYVNLIKDERLKADLIHRLIQRSMTPDQLRAIAEIEASKAKQAEVAVSQPQLEPIRDTNEEEESDSDSVRLSNTEEQTHRRETNIEQAPATNAAAETNEALGSALKEDLAVEADAPAVNIGSLELVRAEEQAEKYIDSYHLAEVEKQKVAAAEAEADDEPEIDALALVTSGREVYAIDPLRQSSLDKPHTKLSFEDGRLGSLRSIRIAGEGRERVALAGARNGLYTTLLAHRKGAREFPIGPGVNARTGINAAVLYKGFIYATHSEFGLLRWPWLQPYSSAHQVMPELISRYSTTRSLMLFDDRLLFANGPTALLLEATNDSGSTLRVAARYKGARHEVTALAEDGDFVMVADAAGDIFVWDPRTSEPALHAFHAGSAISDMAATDLKGGRKCLLVAIKRPVMPMLFRDGSTALEFGSPEPVRSCSVLNGTIVGLSRDRMRLFAWRENRPDWPQWQFQFVEPVLDVNLVPPGRLAE
ncbi:MAG: hypothetical protein OEY28_11780, partial [Nitrospira sp.]|nr:hypothetical protein [Nitrospira sp.]